MADDPAPTTDPPAVVEDVKDPAAVLEMQRKTDAENRKLKAERGEDRKELKRLRELEESMQSDQERAIAKARDEAIAATTEQFQSQLLRERVAARAALVMADPSDSILLETDGLSYDDTTGIDKALTGLIQQKPHLARDPKKQPLAPSTPQGPVGTVAGPGSDGKGPDDWLRGELRDKGLPA